MDGSPASAAEVAYGRAQRPLRSGVLQGAFSFLQIGLAKDDQLKVHGF